MTLLIRPDRQPSEGPRGYRLRLSEANMLPPSLTYLVDLELASVGAERAIDLERAIWAYERARYCPHCLTRDGFWRLGWELLFADACSSCGCWLVDTCRDCGDNPGWRRDNLMRCRCGAALGDETTSAAPLEVARLSLTLEQRALASTELEISELSKMSPVQCTKLIRLIGAYGTLNGHRKPQKILRSGSVANSWPISSFAAEVLCNWPDGLHTLLDKLRAGASAHDRGRMNGSFGGFYRALYVALREQAFDWVRDAFEDYVAEHWTGSIGLRNRRLPVSILERINWMPSQAAAKQLGVSARRLALLIASGQIDAQQRTTRNGRAYQVVRRSDLAAVRVGNVSEMMLAQAADALGLKRQRLARLLPTVCPAAIKAADRGAAWAIPRSWVERWAATLDALPFQTVDTRTEVTLDHVLRFWVASDDALARLLLDIESGGLRPLGRVAAHEGLPSLVLGRSDSMRYAAKPDDAIRAWLTIPEAAERLAVKQEVAYALARLGLIRTDIQRIGRRHVHGVHQRDLDAFRAQYVFAREIATTLRRSPRAIVCALGSLGIQPAAGPNVNGCRQVVYVRAAVEAVVSLSAAST